MLVMDVKGLKLDVVRTTKPCDFTWTQWSGRAGQWAFGGGRRVQIWAFFSPHFLLWPKGGVLNMNPVRRSR